MKQHPPASFLSSSSSSLSFSSSSSSSSSSSVSSSSVDDDGESQQVTTNSPAPPSRFASDFQIEHIIGSGTFGTVYCCKGKMDSVLYAVKRSKRRFNGIKERNLMLSEVTALASLSARSEDAEQSIVRYFTAWIEEDHVYLQVWLV